MKNNLIILKIFMKMDYDFNIEIKKNGAKGGI